ENQLPIATLLLNRLGTNRSLELVYTGVVPGARRRGVGSFLIRWALGIAAMENRGHLSLAVDSRNFPALRLYLRHGLLRIGARTALICDLRSMQAVYPGQLGNFLSSTASPHAR
ncbi:MAG: GNAT family N-acetyltransferase, partial [Phycisphaerae bacterium]|nr:GNAT family N-acetyltransferase [Phycisphaerae bacterium]